MAEPRIIELREYEESALPAHQLTEDEGDLLWQRYGDQVDVQFPSPRTGRRWLLKPRGWAGYIPLSPDLNLSLQPKVQVSNVFRMLEYAYRLELRLLEGLMESASLQEFYERLANVLAKRVLDRVRRGLHRAYVPDADRLAQLRGRLDIQQRVRQPWSVALPCDFHEHSADLEDNQILAWTLTRIAHSGSCSERVLPNVRSAFRAMQGSISMVAFQPSQCVGRLYSRLNEDYHPLHALCRFFLQHAGPTHERGNREMIPFLLQMDALFEKFVAEWLRAHLPGQFRLEAQESVRLAGDHGFRFNIDLVVYDAAGNRPLAVLDTKYKRSAEPSMDDVHQAVAYAESKGCVRAFLIYPVEVPFSVRVGRITVGGLAFGLADDLEGQGQRFLTELLSRLDPASIEN